jgi:hypothetical protein
MVNIILSKPEIDLMKMVCGIQIESFTRLLNGESSMDIREKLSQIHVSEEEMKEINQFMIRQYREIQKDPESLFSFNKEFLQNFRSVLNLYRQDLSGHRDAVDTVAHRIDLALFVMQHLN